MNTDTPLSKIATVVSGTGFPSELQGRSDGEYPFYKVSDMNLPGNEVQMHHHNNAIDEATRRSLRAVVCPAGTIIFPKIGAAIATNKKRVLTRPACFDNNVMGICPGSTVDAAYLFYLLQVIDLTSLSNPGNPPSIRKTVVEDLEISLPPINDQNRIVAVLDKAAGVKANAEKAIAELEKLQQSVFLEMFGDPYLNPKRWEVGVIGDLLSSTTYGTSKKASESEGKLPILRMGNLTYSGSIDTSDLKYIDLDEKDIPRHLVSKGEILFNRTNSRELVGKTAVYSFDEPMAFAGYLIKGVPNELCNVEYLGAFMNLPSTKTYLKNKCRNIVGMANINAREFAQIPIPMAPKPLQDDFGQFVKQLEIVRGSNMRQLQELNSLFGSLQGMAFTGAL